MLRIAHMKKLILIIFIISSSAFCQSRNADTIINNVKKAFDRVKDYVVDVTIRTDIKFVKVPDMHAKVYFKQPDKVHFESEGFALLPKNGMFTSPMSFLNDNYTAVYVKDENFEGYNTSVVKVIPLNDKGNLVLTTLWIDQSGNVIRKAEATTKTNGTLSLVLDYNKNMTYPLPDSMVLSLDVPNFNADRRMRGNFNEEHKNNNEGMIKGKIYIAYSGYIVNKGIPDSLFAKNKSDSFGK